MESTVRRTIVVSGVNIRKGGTLTILRQCLEYLSGVAGEKYRVIALVHKRELCDFPNVDYIEFPDTIKSWGRRLKCEYLTMNDVSRKIAVEDGHKVYLWLSLHDTSPRVEAEHQAVYCQTSFPFMRWRMSDLRFDYKIALFSMFTKFAYKVNIKSNDYLIVQTQWLREGFSKMFNLPQEKFIVAPPKRGTMAIPQSVKQGGPYIFFYPATPDCHKNFELLLKASRLLEQKLGENCFKTVITLNGKENKYSKWLYGQWGNQQSIEFKGFLSKEQLAQTYADSDCLVFPSRVETWGLPISEFAATEKPMLLADLPYAHETAAGYKSALFFDSADPKDLAQKMKSLVEGNARLEHVPEVMRKEPFAPDWAKMFDYLLKKSEF